MYYDPNLATAGRTPIEDFRLTVSTKTTGTKTTHTQFPLLYIKLGPSVLDFTDTFIQATLWHEFVHYSRINEFRGEEAGKSSETKQLQEEAEISPPGTELESNEVEATSKEIAEFGASLNDDEVKSNLLYLSRFLAGAHPVFRTQAIDRVVESATSAGQVKRFVKLIDGIHNKSAKSTLKPLRDALAAAPSKHKP